ncbi:MAG: COX15/CtaA family protein [Gemmataceae bacterium]|nr:COX15/CtaA family protein [Gemmataceae bacterium]
MTEGPPTIEAHAPPRWVHWWAVLTVCLTLPLLILGAEVTTRGVGMVDQRGFRWPGEIIRILADSGYRESLGLVLSFGLVIELTHRLSGFLVGIAAIVLCVGLLATGRGWKRWLGVAVLGAVTSQGLLGRYRVDLNALFGNTLSLVHGCVAHLVFALLVSVALWTSRGWVAAGPAASPRLRRWSLVVLVLIFGQLVLGALVRHKDLTLGARAHLLGAFVVVGAVVWLVRLAREAPPGERAGTRAVGVLASLVALQLVLGVESWLSKFAVDGHMLRQVEPLPVETDLIRSAHYLVGALTFAASVAVALLTHRQASWAARTVPAPAPSGRLEGAA